MLLWHFTLITAAALELRRQHCLVDPQKSTSWECHRGDCSHPNAHIHVHVMYITMNFGTTDVYVVLRCITGNVMDQGTYSVHVRVMIFVLNNGVAWTCWRQLTAAEQVVMVTLLADTCSGALLFSVPYSKDTWMGKSTWRHGITDAHSYFWRVLPERLQVNWLPMTTSTHLWVWSCTNGTTKQQQLIREYQQTCKSLAMTEYDVNWYNEQLQWKLSKF